MRDKFLATLLVFCGLAAACKDDEAYCDAEGLTDALARAEMHDWVYVGSCRVTGAFSVPAGVTIAGRERDVSVLVSDGSGPVLRLEGSEATTRVVDLGLETDGPIGILARGSGAVDISRVNVSVSKGIGIGIDGLSEASIETVEITGTATVENTKVSFGPPTLDEAAIHGIVVERVGSASLNDVDVAGFGWAAAVFRDSAVEWVASEVTGNVAHGIIAQGGSVSLSSIELSDTLQAEYTLLPPIQALFHGGATVETDRLSVVGGEGIGVFEDGVDARHHVLTASGNAQAGLWVQRSTSFELTGASSITGNGLVGVVLIETGETLIEGARIEGSTLVPASCGYVGSGMCNMGDGVQITFPTGGARLSDVALWDNERVGLLLSREAESVGAIRFENVEVSGTGDQLGAIAQGSVVPEDWDEGIFRFGETTSNDASLEGGLGVLLSHDTYALDSILDQLP